jgi:AbrB family looped-hinge helix DNA binding protein
MLVLYFMLKCKAMIEATLSTKNQIVIPREAREALGLQAGDKLLVVTRGDSVIVFRKPSAHQKAIRGLARNAYPKGYLRKERTSWE